MKKKVLFLMVDIETYGTAPSSIVRQISCIPFSINVLINILEGKHFNEYANTSLQKDRTVDLDTVRWWNSVANRETNCKLIEQESLFGQNPEALAKQWVEYVEGLRKGYSLRFIGRGATTFDIPILKNFCEMYGQKFSPAYYHVYDMRSFVSICENFTGMDLKGDNKGAHDALEDCKNQINQLKNCVNALRGLDVSYF